MSMLIRWVPVHETPPPPTFIPHRIELTLNTQQDSFDLQVIMGKVDRSNLSPLQNTIVDMIITKARSNTPA